MVCKNCGTQLDQDSMFCTTCGAKVEKEVFQPAPAAQPFVAPPVYAPIPTPIPQKPKAKLNLSKLIGLIVGSLLVLIGLIQVMSAGSTISSTSFGADFYTYTYRGIVAITKQLASIHSALGWVIVAIGAGIDINALRK